jgi:hypothetical protein
MAEAMTDRPPRSFWILSGAALLWNLLGLMAYVTYVTMSEEAIAALPEAERIMYENPAWVTAAFATAVTAGTLGCILLLLRKGLALPVLIVSLGAVLLQMSHAFLLSDVVRVAGAQAAVMPVMVTVVAVLLAWYAWHAKQRRWLG